MCQRSAGKSCGRVPHRYSKADLNDLGFKGQRSSDAAGEGRCAAHFGGMFGSVTKESKIWSAIILR
jgi:hypothetical protein